MKKCLLSGLALSALSACASGQASGPFNADVDQAMADVTYLSSDELKGRRAGTPENVIAREYVTQRLKDCGVGPLNGTYEHPFEFIPRFNAAEGNEPDPISATNVVTKIEGKLDTDKAIIVTAHFDHVGVNNDEIYNGADDNASGTAGLLALACHYTEHQPDHDILFIAFDAEEMGLRGARAFVGEEIYPLTDMIMNVNLDMISRGVENRLWAVGTAQYPSLKPVITELAQGFDNLTIHYGYDDPELPRSESWVLASDQAPFFQAGVPFIFFSVEDHPDYHQPTDTAEKINPAFYGDTISLIGRFVAAIDNDPDLPTATAAPSE